MLFLEPPFFVVSEITGAYRERGTRRVAIQGARGYCGEKLLDNFEKGPPPPPSTSASLWGR